MKTETEQGTRWVVSKVAASTPPKRGRLYTKGIHFDLIEGANGHLDKIQIHDKDPKEAERLAAIIAACLNKAETTRHEN